MFFCSLITLMHSHLNYRHHFCHCRAQTCLFLGFVMVHLCFLFFYFILLFANTSLLIHNHSLNSHHHCCHCLTTMSITQTMPAGIVWAYGTFFFLFCLFANTLCSSLPLPPLLLPPSLPPLYQQPKQCRRHHLGL